MKWGLLPSFAKKKEDYDLFQGGPSTFNARVESVESSGLWRRLVDKRRCVVLFDGFYEWKKVGSSKVPMYIRNPDDFNGHCIPLPASLKSAKDTNQDELTPSGGALLPLEATGDTPSTQQSNAAGAGAAGDGPRHAPLLLAGLFDTWRPPKGAGEGRGAEDDEEVIESATILTMESDGTPIFPIHDRSPIFLTPESAAEWLDTSRPFKDVIHSVVRGAREHAQRLLIYEVPTLVSNMRNDTADCIVPKKEYDGRQFARGLGKFFSRKAAPMSNDCPAGNAPQKRPPSPTPPAVEAPAKAARVEPAAKDLPAAEPPSDGALVIDLDD